MLIQHCFSLFLSAGGSDFEVNIVMLTFAPGMLQDCFNVTIIDDDLYENPEEFFANITTIETQVNIFPMTTVITIIDNDGMKDESAYCNIFISILQHLHQVSQYLQLSSLLLENLSGGLL